MLFIPIKLLKRLADTKAIGTFINCNRNDSVNLSVKAMLLNSKNIW